jgi:hypothetical protein
MTQTIPASDTDRATAEALADGLRRVAAFIEANPALRGVGLQAHLGG